MSAIEKIELIKILKTDIGAEELNSVNTRELYEFLELGEGHYLRWIESNLIEQFEENVDFITTSHCVGSGNLQKEITTYIVTLDVAKHLCMLAKTEKAMKIRKYFIDVEKQANKPMTVEQLLLENAKMIENLQTKVIRLEDKVEEQKPKVLFADSVAQSDTSILIGQFAKAISTADFQIGQNKLFQWLRDNKYLIASGTRFNQPMQQYIDNKYFEVIERTVNNPDGSSRITLTTKITGKGQVALTKRLENL